MESKYPIRNHHNVVLARKSDEVLNTSDRMSWRDSYQMGNITHLQELRNWAIGKDKTDRHTFTHMATLNLVPQCRNEIAANRALGFFIKKFERELFGANGVKSNGKPGRPQRRLNWFPVLQMNELSGLHLHMAIGGIPERHMEDESRLSCLFMRAAECWEFKHQNKHFDRVDDEEDWIEYITRWLEQDQLCAEHIHLGTSR
jgi:hypothetical protein